MNMQMASQPTVHDSVPGRALLRMAVGEQVLAVPIEDVREILQVTRLTPMPRTPAFVRGVMNLRGAVVPVIDLAARLFGLPTDIGRRSCIVVVECLAPGSEGEAEDAPPPGAFGLLVDAVFEVFDAAGGEPEAVPALGTQVDAEFLECMARARGEVVGVLALQRVLSPRDLGAAIAAYLPQ